MIGEHTDEVLQDLLGVTDEKLQVLRNKKAIRSKEEVTQKN
jgi:hypothetical protein